MATHAVERFPVTIQGMQYAVDPEGYRRTTVPILRDQFDQSTEAGEQTLSSQMWARSQTDWSMGAGQEYYDNDDSDRHRFFSSSGVDPWTKGKAKLLPICESKNNAKTWTDVIARRLGAYIYVASGTDLFYTANITDADASVTWTTVTALASPQTITDFSSDGTTVFISYGSARALASTSIGATTQPSSLGALTPDWVKVVGGRLIIGDANVLTEVDASGVATGLDFTSPHAGSTWVTSCVGPAGLYAASNTDTGIVHFIPVLTATGLLDDPRQAAELPRGETINDMTSYGGMLILATSAGLRLAAVDSHTGGVTYGPVLDDAGAAQSLATDGRFVWWGGTLGQVWRADLSKFTEPLVPAYASDLVSVGDGNGLGNVAHLMRYSNDTFFVDDANGVQGQESTGILVSSATLTIGDIRWNSQIDKVLRTVEVRSAPDVVAGGNTSFDDATDTYDDTDLLYDGEATSVAGTVKVRFTADTGIQTNLQTLTDKTETVVVPTITTDKIKIVFTLERNATTTTAGPSLESWLIQAFPSPSRIDEIVVPVMLQRRVATSRGQGAAATTRAQTEFDALRALMVAKTVVTLEEGTRSESVVIDQMSMAAERMADDGDWWEGVLTLRLLTVPS